MKSKLEVIGGKITELLRDKLNQAWYACMLTITEYTFGECSTEVKKLSAQQHSVSVAPQTTFATRLVTQN